MDKKRRLSFVGLSVLLLLLLAAMAVSLIGAGDSGAAATGAATGEVEKCCRLKIVAQYLPVLLFLGFFVFVIFYFERA
jgi:hypothetical protein